MIAIRVNDAPKKKDAARRIMADEHDEGMVSAKNDWFRFFGGQGIYKQGGRGCLRALFVYANQCVVNKAGQEQF